MNAIEVGERAFSVAGHAAWNNLPIDIHTTSSSTPALLQTCLYHNFYDITVH